MRDFKFRVWTNFYNEMQYFDLFSVINHRYDGLWLSHQEGKINLRHQDNILMQYTGLKDKNGKEIYEGDIIEFVHPNMRSEEVKAVVVWGEKKSGFRAKIYDKYARKYKYYSVAQECEVIGNQYETPVLLEEVCDA